MRSLLILAIAIGFSTALFAPFQVLADQVVPSDRVTSGVIIREHATSNSDRLGLLGVGGSLEWLRDLPRWREVRMSAALTGFVSKSWTRRIPDAAMSDGPLSARAQDELRIHYLPIGAGTCTVVECPGANAPPMIMDCGSLGGSSRGPNDLDEIQATAAVSTILANHTASPNLVLSHGDKDHYSYLDTVLQGVQLDQVWQGGASDTYPDAFQTLLETQDNNGATLHQNLPADFHNNQLLMGSELSCGDASVFVLTVNSGTSKNANSLILAIDYGDFSATFTGDAEGSTESQAIQNYNGAVKTIVLSGSHHGSHTHGSNGEPESRNTRSNWPASTAPEVIIYSAGRRFGHPRCSITDNYHSTLARVSSHPMHCGADNNDNTPHPFQTRRAEYTTEVSGTIVVTTDGTSPLSIHCTGAAGCAAEVAF